MGRHGLQNIDKSVVLKPKQPTQLPAKKRPSPRTPDKRSGGGLDLSQYAGEVVSIFKMVMEGKLEIARIQAQTEAQLQLIEKDIEKIWASADAEINKMTADGKVWGDKFEKKKATLLAVIQKIEANPDMPEAVQMRIIEAATALISQ